MGSSAALAAPRCPELRKSAASVGIADPRASRAERAINIARAAQKLAASVGNRAPPHGGGGERRCCFLCERRRRRRIQSASGSHAAVLDERTSRHVFRLRVREEGSGSKVRSSRAERAINIARAAQKSAASVGNRAPPHGGGGERRCCFLCERRRRRRIQSAIARAAQKIAPISETGLTFGY